MTRPACFNRPPFAGTSERYGLDSQTGEVIRVTLPRWFEDRCATWDGVGIGPNGERYPQAHGWDCSGCRWLPEEYA